jgi:hypothetical protein
MTLRIIGAGFGRTGTASLKEALEKLGFGPCDHMADNFNHPARFSLWAAALDQKQRGGAIDWQPLFHQHQAVVDWPGAYFWRELVNVNPQAKVILTVRDADRWYDSVASTIYRMPKALESSLAVKGIMAVAGMVDARPRDAVRVIDGAIWQGTFGGRFADRQHAIDVYTAHNAAVERTVSPDRLLVFDVAEGWEPLCRFLGVPVPDEPFPHVNDRADFDRRVKQRLIPAAAAVAGGAILGLAALAALAAGVGKQGQTRNPVRDAARTTAGPFGRAMDVRDRDMKG